MSAFYRVGNNVQTRVGDFIPAIDANAATHTQVAALCYRMRKGKPQVLMVTSRDTGRWILPKGWTMKGKTGSEAAAIEAWEEAGVQGKIASEPVGVYSYLKLRDKAPDLPCMVLVYPLCVEKLSARFPEHRQRRLKWMGRTKASKSVREPELAALLRSFDPVALRVQGP